MTSSVFCIVLSELKAGDIVSRLKSSGLRDEAISVLFPDRSGMRPVASDRNGKSSADSGAIPRGVVGGALGLLAGIGLMPLPGIGPFIAAGPMLTALSAMAMGPSFTGIAGVLARMGLPETDAKRYESNVRNGSVLISAHSDNVDEIINAKEIFQKSGASDIGSASEKTSLPPDLSPITAVSSSEPVSL